MTFWNRRWVGPIVILLTGLCVQQLIAFMGQYTVHQGYIERKLHIAEKANGRGYYRDRLDIPQEYGRLIANTPVNRWPVLWYQGEDGRIRNVEIHNDLNNPLVFERASHVTVP